MIEENDNLENIEMSEGEIDETLEDSFPASDPPSWNSGTNHKNYTVDSIIEDKNSQEKLEK